jgi:hypothetical protein
MPREKKGTSDATAEVRRSNSKTRLRCPVTIRSLKV